jgi:hypothetical protein
LKSRRWAQIMNGATVIGAAFEPGGRLLEDGAIIGGLPTYYCTMYIRNKVEGSSFGLLDTGTDPLSDQPHSLSHEPIEGEDDRVNSGWEEERASRDWPQTIPLFFVVSPLSSCGSSHAGVSK